MGIRTSITLADGRVDIKSLDRDALRDFMQGMGKEGYRALQVYKWAWQRGVTDFDEMSNISKKTREKLKEQAVLTHLEQAHLAHSSDGTKKFLWRLHDGHHVESVLIPDTDREVPDVLAHKASNKPLKDRMTLCVSSQVGCAMACTFCLTGDLGIIRHLSPAEIASQPLQVQQHLGPDQRISNIVLMGMGEPLHNYDNLVTALRIMLDEDGLNFSHRRITVSTVGLIPAMQKLADTLPVNVAVSLNATTEEQRRAVMPVTRKHSLADLMQACRDLPIPKAKRITFEYVMMAGFNDSMDDAARLVQLMRGVKSKVNLIPYNENPDRDIKSPSPERVKAFQHHLVNHGVQASIRTPRGQDISAACGQLGKAAEGLG